MRLPYHKEWAKNAPFTAGIRGQVQGWDSVAFAGIGVGLHTLTTLKKGKGILAVRGAEAVETFLDRHRRVGLDTSVFIFETEKHPRYIELVRPVFRWLMGPAGLGVTSTITMLEVLVQSYRAGDQKRAGDFLALLSTYPHLQWIAQRSIS
jgi:hypothetical protein